jgi:hypothetical protein
VEEGELEGLAGELAGFGEGGETAGGGAVEFSKQTFDARVLFEGVGDEGVGIDLRDGTRFQGDFHGDGLAPPGTGDGLLDFTASFFFAQLAAAVPGFLATGDGDFAFGNAITEIDAKGDEGKALLLGFGDEFVDFAAVEEELAGAEGLVIPDAAGEVAGNVAMEEPDFAVFDSGVGIAEVGVAIAEGFDLGAAEDEAGFHFVEEEVMERGGTIGGNHFLGAAIGLVDGFFRRGAHNATS